MDVKVVVKETDPQSASMAKAIGADQNVIELGSGVGFWLVFGHGAPSVRRENARVAAPSMTQMPIELTVVEEKPQEIIERFFLEILRPALNRRVQSLAVWSAYDQWFASRSRCRVARNVRALGEVAQGADRRNRLVPRFKACRRLRRAGGHGRKDSAEAWPIGEVDGTLKRLTNEAGRIEGEGGRASRLDCREACGIGGRPEVGDTEERDELAEALDELLVQAQAMRDALKVKSDLMSAASSSRPSRPILRSR